MFIILLFFIVIISGILFVYLAYRGSGKYQILSLISTAIENEMPLPDLLTAHAQSYWGGRKQKMLDLADMLREGVPLPIALENYRSIIPVSGQLAVRVGGETGTLKECLQMAAETYLNRPFLKGYGLYSLNLYLSFLFVATVLISAFMIYLIHPKYSEIMSAYGVEHNLEFTIVTKISKHFVSYCYIYLPLLLVAGFTIYRFLFPNRGLWGYLLQNKYLRGALSNLVMPLYFISNRIIPTWKKWACPEVLSYLEVAARANLPLGMFMESLANHHPAPEIRATMDQVRQRLRLGNDLWQELKQAQLLDGQQAKSLQAAETLGQLAAALRFQQDYFQTHAVYQTELRLEIVRFVLVLFLASWIALIACAYFLPIVQMIMQI